VAEDWTKFPPIPAPSRVRGPKATLIGVMGPPGSGKTRTVLRMMRGVQRVFPGPVVLIDTEAGRSSLFQPKEGELANPNDPVEPTYEFERIDLDAPYRGDRCWTAIKSALTLHPAAIGFDNISDEHTGEGGYLWWHDQEIERVGGNEWGAWARPAAARTRLISGVTHVPPPPILFFTFIAQEKTEQVTVKDERTGRDRKKVIDKGWTPVAPLMILKALDLTCILPWDSKGTPIWEARKLPGEEFARKWPEHLTRLMVPGQITEEHGEALARWVKGDPARQPDRAPAGQPGPNSGTLLDEVLSVLRAHFRPEQKNDRAHALELSFGTPSWKAIEKMDQQSLAVGLAGLKKVLEAPALMREPGEDPEEGA
jgi:ABC-type cobalamin/Fe3+-siderophores transport system ATPase subunit